MARYNIGDRVGAILGSKDRVVKFLGYGVYQGKEVPKTAVGRFAESAVVNNLTNPKIKLENGSVVWGCECWWGPEDRVREMLETADQIIKVDIEDYRRKLSSNES